jgi:hypothetical protein
MANLQGFSDYAGSAPTLELLTLEALTMVLLTFFVEQEVPRVATMTPPIASCDRNHTKSASACKDWAASLD